METKPLTLNVLNFAHKEPSLTFYLTTFCVENAVKLSKKDIAFFIDYLLLSPDTEMIYTTFEKETEGGQAVTLQTFKALPDENKSCWSYSFLKKYYTHYIVLYFNNLGFPTKSNFVSDVDVWIPAKSPYVQCNGYRVYNVKVQFGVITLKPELVVSVGGVRSVLKESLTSVNLQELSPDLFNWVIFENQLYRYEEMPDKARRNLDLVFPCLNKTLQKALKIPHPAPDKSNRYVRYWNDIELFKTKYLQTEAFGKILNLKNSDWYIIPSIQLENKEKKLSTLLFGNGGSSQEPKNGMRMFGPKELTPNRKVVFFYICHETDKQMAKAVNEFMKGNKTGFVGIHKYAGISYHTDEGLSIVFADKVNPLPELITKLNLRTFQTDSLYVALYLSPYGKWDSNEEHKAIYYRVKEELLHRGIVSQVIEVDKNWAMKRVDENENAILLDSFKYAFANIAVALCAKLGGTPWSLKYFEVNELVIGISAFNCESLDTKYLGSAFSFSSGGKFHGFDCFRSNQTNELAGSILKAVKDYCDENVTLSRLIIHFYKTLSWKELQPIEDGLAGLGLKIPVVVVSINKTFSEDVIGFDLSQAHKMPFSGTYISIGNNQYLLYNSGLVDNVAYTDREGYPFPLKLSMRSYAPNSKKSERVDDEVVPELLFQICQFSQLYWKSVSKQSLPVTLKYPEMLAQIVPHFLRPQLPKTGKETLWFL